MFVAKVRCMYRRACFCFNLKKKAVCHLLRYGNSNMGCMDWKLGQGNFTQVSENNFIDLDL